jgi:hypothetical protein
VPEQTKRVQEPSQGQIMITLLSYTHMKGCSLTENVSRISCLNDHHRWPAFQAARLPIFGFEAVARATVDETHGHLQANTNNDRAGNGLR